MTSHRPQHGASWALLGATAVWGATFVSVKGALDDADAFTFLALRFMVGAVVAGLLALLFGERRGWRRAFPPGLLLGALLFGGYALQTLGLATSSPSRSSFITGLTVLFVPLVSWRLDRTRPPRRAFVAPFIALLGLQQMTGFSWRDPIPFGDLLTLGCAAVYAVHIALMSRLTIGVLPMTLTTIQLATVSVLATACLPMVTPRLVPTPSLVIAIVFTGVVASALAIGVQAWAQARLSAVRASVIYALEPLFTVGFAVIAGEAPTTRELIGGGLMLVAILVSEVPLPRRRAPAQNVGG